MSDLCIDTAEVGSAADDLGDRSDDAMQMTALTFVDVRHAGGTEAIAALARSAGAFPAAFMEQISLVTMAVDLGVQDAVVADCFADRRSGPR